jgi:GTPase SAR1 family protein
VNTRHELFGFDGRWKSSFGSPPKSGAWIIYGTSGSGKTSFALQLVKYLTRFERVLYWSIEQGNSAALQASWIRERVNECGNDVLLADEEVTFDAVVRQLKQRGGRHILVVDSLTPLRAQSFDVRRYEAFRKRLHGKLIIWLGHERGCEPDTVTGAYILKMADLKMRVEGFRVMTTNRMGNSFPDYTIWEQGCREYWGVKN